MIGVTAQRGCVDTNRYPRAVLEPKKAPTKQKKKTSCLVL